MEDLGLGNEYFGGERGKIGPIGIWVALSD